MKQAEKQAQAPSPGTLRRLAREANDMGLTVDQLIDRALIALADEVDTTRHGGGRTNQ